MKKFLVLIFLVQILVTNCALNTNEMYKDEIHELLRDPKTRSFHRNENDVNDLSGCQILFEVAKWEKDGKYWKWFDGKIISSNGVALDLPISSGYKNLNIILQNSSQYYPIYIGPWQEITLTHSTGFFPFTKTINEKKNIRFFAYMAKEGGNISYQYESMNEENKNIKEKPFSLPNNAKIAPDQFGLCVVKWTAKYGYNAIAEVKSKNSWSKDYLVPTGRIIDSKTGEVIANKE